MKRFILAASIATMLVLSIPLFSYAEGYIDHILSSPGGSYSWAFDINDSGQIVGGINGGDPYVQQAILWNNYNSSPHSLDEGNESAHARLINNLGLVVGTHDSLLGSILPFKWSATDGVTDIPDVSFYVEALNESGTIVGFRYTGIEEAPIMMSSTGQVTYLDNTCGGLGGKAFDINNSGYTVGVSYLPDRWGGMPVFGMREMQ